MYLRFFLESGGFAVAFQQRKSTPYPHFGDQRSPSLPRLSAVIQSAAKDLSSIDTTFSNRSRRIFIFLTRL
jgi:hypothetical protein